MTIQTTYGFDRTAGISGSFIVDPPEVPRSAINMEPNGTTQPGKGLTWYGGSKDKVRLPHPNKIVLSVSADLVASDSFDIGVKLTDIDGTEGSELSPSPVAYSSSHNATMTAIAAAIDALSANITASVTAAREITIKSINDYSIEVSTAAAITNGGAGTAVASTVYGCNDAIIGFSGRRKYQEASSAGLVTYDKYEPVPVVRAGDIFVVSEEALTLDSDDSTTTDLYVRFTGGSGTNEERGTLRGSAGSSPVVAVALGSGFELQKTVSADGLSELRINK